MSQTTPELSDCYDVLACGFGPASLALAIALVEPSPNPTPTYSSLGGLQEALGRASSPDKDAQRSRAAERGPLKACFIEKQEQFKWHPGMMLEGSNMQISFLKDLATLRNPQSAYTFLVYLASFTPSRLVSYISRETFTPSRREFSDYLAWAARKVEGDLATQGGQVAFGEEVVAVEAVVGNESSDVRILKVTSRDVKTGATTERFTRNIVLSTGGSPRLPHHLSTPDIEASGRVIHSSAFLDRIHPALDSLTAPLPASRALRVAVLGAGQSAAETFLALRDAIASHLPADVEHRPQIDLLIRSATLRPADDSASTNEVFDPGMSQAVYGVDSTGRSVMLQAAKATNYSVANPHTLAAMYETLYAQQVEVDIATRDNASFAKINRDPKLAIRPFIELTGARPPASADAPLTLELWHSATSLRSSDEYDLVICGTG
ncbi:L-lysine 6-monooxygenase [Leucosporidium creatinivorum]|uniref:L-ornithine N(5)-monooxygenase [NAD(P)H] n=1 Tax=Leucosporidium creatinivorum TaxID=106004 RepID=A0A1Y2FG78_9BASI|nr:L-lysine 6-monooxygenase [Leucosporidium creatinivorum]